MASHSKRKKKPAFIPVEISTKEQSSSEIGTFELSQYDILSGGIILSYTKMAMIVDGLSIKNIVSRKRYKATKLTVIS